MTTKGLASDEVEVVRHSVGQKRSTSHVYTDVREVIQYIHGPTIIGFKDDTATILSGTEEMNVGSDATVTIHESD